MDSQPSKPYAMSNPSETKDQGCFGKQKTLGYFVSPEDTNTVKLMFF